MTERSYPIVNKNLTETDWQTIQIVNGNGVIDEGGWPYLLVDINSATNTVGIAVDQKTGKNKAYLSGFIHEITHQATLNVPGVTSETTYEIGLVYDPTNNIAEGGPISMQIYTLPVDNSGDKTRLPLYRITRKPNVTLENSTILEIRQRTSHIEVVNTEAQLPVAESTLIETVALTRDKGEFYRLNKVSADNSLQWVKLGSDDATYLPTPNTVMKRAYSGATRVENGGHSKDAINNETLDNALGGSGWVRATPYPDGNSIVRRWDSGVIRVGTSTANKYDALNLAAGDSRYARINHNHNGDDITSGIVRWESISGSTHAYKHPASGTYATLAVSSSGRFMRWTSAKKYKTNIEEWDSELEDLLSPVVYTYQRYNEDGSVNPKVEVGVIADYNAETLPEFMEYGDDGEVEGWSYMTWTAAIHRTNQLQQEQIEELKRKDAEKDQLIADLSARLDKLEG